MSETAQKRRANKGSFSAEKPRPGPGRGKKKPKASIGPGVLADMTTAYTTDERPGEPPGVKHARELLAENYEKFMVMYTRMAGLADQADLGMSRADEVQSETVAAAASRSVPMGQKEETVVELAERLLHEWESQ